MPYPIQEYDEYDMDREEYRRQRRNRRRWYKDDDYDDGYEVSEKPKESEEE